MPRLDLGWASRCAADGLLSGPRERGAPQPNPMPQAWGPAANRINAPPANQRQQTQAPPTLLRSAAFMRIATSSLERQRAAAVGAMSLDPRLGALLRAVREGDVLRRSRAVGTDH
jgi:hypothetical protein